MFLQILVLFQPAILHVHHFRNLPVAEKFMTMLTSIFRVHLCTLFSGQFIFLSVRLTFLLTSHFSRCFKKHKLYWSFSWMGFNYLKATTSLRRNSLLFTTRSQGVRSAHLNNLGRMKG